MPSPTSDNITLYVNAFTTNIDASNAILPTEFIDASFTSFDATFETDVNASVLLDNEIFTFVRDPSLNTLRIYNSNPLQTDASFSVVNSRPSSVSGGQTIYFSHKTGTPTLHDDYLGYLATKLLGSQYLVGAFGNVEDVINSIQDTVPNGIHDTIALDCQNAPFYEVDELTGLATGNPPGDSALWSVYSTILEQRRERIDGSGNNAVADNTMGPLLYPGDKLVLLFTIHQDVDASVLDAFGAVGSTLNDTNFTWTAPDVLAQRVYKVIINVV